MNDKLSERMRAYFKVWEDAGDKVPHYKRHWADEVAALEQRVERLDKLIPYTDHVYSTCTSASGRQLKCLCGLDAALALAEEEA